MFSVYRRVDVVFADPPYTQNAFDPAKIVDTTQEDAKDLMDSVGNLEIANTGVARYVPDKQDNLTLFKS